MTSRISVAMVCVLAACSGEQNAISTIEGACTADADCGAGLVCVTGFCKISAGGPCKTNDECAAPLLCEEKICKVPPGNDCKGPKPCVAGYVCEADVCKGGLSKGCGSGIVCQEGLECSSGFCRVAKGGACSAPNECADGTVCDDTRCRAPVLGACGASGDCRTGTTCVEGKCTVPKNGTCSDPAECAAGLSCFENICRVPIGGGCTATTDCLSGLLCDAESKCRAPKGGTCASTADCRAGLVCDGTTCHVPVLGACTEGDCVTGLDCFEGTCRARAGAACPTGLECGDGLACDSGVCKGDLGEACVAQSCAGGLVCEANVCVGELGAPCVREADCQGALVCDVDTCHKAVNQACGPGECANGLVCESGLCKVKTLGACQVGQCATGLSCIEGQCRADVGTGCSGDLECADGSFCENGKCRGRLGTACSAGTCAAALQCTDGRCVATAGGACARASDCAPGLFCENQVCRLPLDGGCSDQLPCRQGLVCSNGLCRVAPGQQCTTNASCAQGFICSDGQCARAIGGSCGTGVPCATGLTCDAGTCRTAGGSSCTPPGDCATGLVCEGGACRAPNLGDCTTNAECPTLNLCLGGKCKGAAGAACTLTTQCRPSFSCVSPSGTCRGAQGAPCSVVADCAAGLTCDRATCVPPAPALTSVRSIDSGADYTATGGSTEYLADPYDTSATYGNALAFGDFDGDGVGDLAIGAQRAKVGTFTSAGRVYVLFGKRGYPFTPQTLDLANPASITPRPVVFSASASSQHVGASVAAGDFNGDGVADLAIGAPGMIGGPGGAARSSAGHVLVFLGGSSFPKADLTIDAATPAVRFYGESGTNLGISLAAGDVNGDHVTDLAMASEGWGTNSTYWDSGAVHVFRGSAAGAFATGANFDVAAGGTALTIRNNSTAIGQPMGSSIAFADADGDGKDDVFVLCETCNATVASASRYGAVLGVKGSRIPAFSGGVAIDNTTANGYGGFDLAWFGPTTARGGNAVAAGDVTGDGRAEILFSASTTGTTLEVFGLKGRANFWTAPPTGAAVSSTASSGGYDWHLSSVEASAELGFRMEIGDVDHDGKGDAVIAAPGISSGSSKGKLHVFWGGSDALFGTSPEATTASAAYRIDGGSARSHLGTCMAVGDFNGDGHADVAASAVAYGPGYTAVHVVLGGTRP